MQCKKTWVIVLGLFAITFFAEAQTDFIGLSDKQYQLLNRLDIKLRNDSVIGFTADKPYNRKEITQRVETLFSAGQMNAAGIEFSAIDKYNIRNLLMNNAEFTKNFSDSFTYAHPLLKTFFTTPAHLFQASGKDFSFIADPVFNLQLGGSNENSGRFFTNTRGLVLKGNIDDRVGFYTYLSDNQERDPLYVRNWADSLKALPGTGFYKSYKTTGYDYFDARGAITFHAGTHFNFAFGYDKLFTGDGYRSLFLSDFSNNFLFFKIDTRFWKIKYENIFAELMADYTNPVDTLRPKKYMTLHHLDVQAFPWLHIGFYESTIFGRSGGYELSYLNPVIFLRSAEQQLGSPDNANVGIDFKINALKNVQFYGQLLLDEFVFKEVTHYSRGSWVNKQALQLGAKYIDAFTIKNLDLQVETNIIRPFVYSHLDSVTSNFSNYNQPLADPLGANVKEYIAIARYQPVPKLFFLGKLIYYKQGLDSAGLNFGGNIFKGYDAGRAGDYGFHTGGGIPVKCLYGSLNISYEFFNNLFMDASAVYRTYHEAGKANQNLFMYSAGLRMNIQRKAFEF